MTKRAQVKPLTHEEAVQQARERCATGADDHATSLRSMRALLAAYDDLKDRYDRDLEEEIEERDRCADAADSLAYAIAPIEVIGEHSSGNDPWENAIEHVGELRAYLLSVEESEEAVGAEAREQVRTLLPPLFEKSVTRIRTGGVHVGPGSVWRIFADYGPLDAPGVPFVIYAEAPLTEDDTNADAARPIEALALSLAAMLGCDYDVTPTTTAIEESDRDRHPV